MNKTFQQEVDLKFHIYNSLFLKLPFDDVYQTGVHLPILTTLCNEYYAQGNNPNQIINHFFAEHFPNITEEEKISALFNFIKYIERQVVLFDAVEEAAYNKINDLEGQGTLAALCNKAKNANLLSELVEKVNSFNLRLVLTAHPTQFYPRSILGIINKLSIAIKKNNLDLINELLMQLAKTPFFNQDKPTPYDEAKSLIWYLENVFYDSIAAVINELQFYLKKENLEIDNDNLVTIGFWPGGDRDGNPNVNSKITRKVALALKKGIFKKYYQDLNVLRNKLTFKDIELRLHNIQEKVYLGVENPEESYRSISELLEDLEVVRSKLIEQHQSLFLADLDSFIVKAKLFGFHFAELDIRQDSSVHERAIEEIINNSEQITFEEYEKLSETEKIEALLNLDLQLDANDFSDPQIKDVIQSMSDIEWIQNENGTQACHRYIISNSKSALHVMQVYALAKLTCWSDSDVSIDIIPLFESIEDLDSADSIMQELFSHEEYKKHLASRNKHQTVMLGFSDGTKDGGYLSANWNIYQAKEKISQVARDFGMDLAFFDGRGGPPARGGGNTHKFYASQGPEITNNQIQLTIQGQTISSNFGALQSAKYNIEQLLSAGIENDVCPRKTASLTAQEKDLLEELASHSLKVYEELKAHDQFLSYLQKVGPLDYYAMTNIGSRPAKRNKGELTLNSLRAIPFVGTWSQIKQNVPGYYGLGYTFNLLEEAGRFQEVKDLYNNSLFFHTLIDNSMQSIKKCYFPLTAHLKDNSEFADIWKNLYAEYQQTVNYLHSLRDKDELMDTNVDIRESIEVREEIMRPLLTIQQYALQKVEENSEHTEAYKNMVMRSMYGIINASRNSA